MNDSIKIELLEQKIDFLIDENKRLWDDRKLLFLEINTLNNVIDCYETGFQKVLNENKQLSLEQLSLKKNGGNK